MIQLCNLYIYLCQVRRRFRQGNLHTFVFYHRSILQYMYISYIFEQSSYRNSHLHISSIFLYYYCRSIQSHKLIFNINLLVYCIDIEEDKLDIDQYLFSKSELLYRQSKLDQFEILFRRFNINLKFYSGLLVLGRFGIVQLGCYSKVDLQGIENQKSICNCFKIQSKRVLLGNLSIYQW